MFTCLRERFRLKFDLLRNSEIALLDLVEREAELATESEAPTEDGTVLVQDHGVLLASCQLHHLVDHSSFISFRDSEIHFKFPWHQLIVRFKTSLRLRWDLLILARRCVYLGGFLITVLLLREVFGSRAQTQLVVVILPCTHHLFELHVELVALQRHDKFVALDEVAGSGVSQFKLLVRVSDGRHSDGTHSDLRLRVLVVERHLGRVHLDGIRLARSNLNRHEASLVVTSERLSKSHRVKVGQVAMHQDHVLLREDDDALLKVRHLGLLAKVD